MPSEQVISKHTEMIYAKIKLEAAITDLIYKFQEQTGVIVTGIDFEQNITDSFKDDHPVRNYHGHTVEIRAELI